MESHWDRLPADLQTMILGMYETRPDSVAPLCCGIYIDGDDEWHPCCHRAHPDHGTGDRCFNRYFGCSVGSIESDDWMEYATYIGRFLPYKVEVGVDGEPFDNGEGRWELPEKFTAEEMESYAKSTILRAKVQWSLAIKHFGSAKKAKKYAWNMDVPYDAVRKMEF